MENSTFKEETEKSILYWIEFSFIIVNIAQFFIAFSVNLLTIIVVVKFDSLHKKPTNILTLGLSIADSLTGKCESRSTLKF